MQCDGHMQSIILIKQDASPKPINSKKIISAIYQKNLNNLPINDGPISLNSPVLNPFSPVPTKAMISPMAVVHKPK